MPLAHCRVRVRKPVLLTVCSVPSKSEGLSKLVPSFAKIIGFGLSIGRNTS
jgi:hypothetical protein